MRGAISVDILKRYRPVPFLLICFRPTFLLSVQIPFFLPSSVATCTTGEVFSCKVVFFWEVPSTPQPVFARGNGFSLSLFWRLAQAIYLIIIIFFFGDLLASPVAQHQLPSEPPWRVTFNTPSRVTGLGSLKNHASSGRLLPPNALFGHSDLIFLTGNRSPIFPANRGNSCPLKDATFGRASHIDLLVFICPMALVG